MSTVNDVTIDREGKVYTPEGCIGYFPSEEEGGKATRITVANSVSDHQPQPF